tara:strand:- start:7103 stop:8440 length:1338 start_codon:yes stop_codon:yes gene_type:complete
MATTLQIQYYNTYILKKINESWNSATGEIDRTNAQYDWYVEESRIKGDFNGKFAGIAPRAYLATENKNQQTFGNSIIYSGIFNSRTDVNETNQFSVANDITRTVDPAKGTIQLLYAEDTNLIIFQEYKVNRALIDKDAIYTAEGQPLTTSSNLVIGQVQSYAGEYGIATNPESFAVYGYRKYFTDANKGAVMRLSQDGLTEISSYGMFDYFRDRLSLSRLGVNGRLTGGYDIHNRQYVLSIQPVVGKSDGSQAVTLSFDEKVRGWVSFYSYIPAYMFSLDNRYYSFNLGGDLWQHYSTGVNRANFYGSNNNSSVISIFNAQPSMSKIFKTINYEGDSGWAVESFLTYLNNSSDTANAIAPYAGPPATLADMEAELLQNKFKAKENKYFADLINTSLPQEGEVIFGGSISGLKGFYGVVTFTTENDGSENNRELFAVSTEYVQSSY